MPLLDRGTKTGLSYSRQTAPRSAYASTSTGWQVRESGCGIWLGPPPFDHSRAFGVDECWSLVGSTNWDPRSLRLNFGFNVNCDDTGLARTLADGFNARLQHSHETTFAQCDARHLTGPLREGAARLLTPIF